ncbi:MAG: carbohydrate kinase family protein [Chloroflexota bacterium]
MNRSAPVLAVGDVNVDLVVPPFDAAAPGAAGSPPTHPTPQLHGGGSSANTAVALARLGLPVAFAGTIGDDGFGRWEIADLQREGVDLRGLRLERDAFTLMALALIQPDGERRILIWPPSGGAHSRFRPEDLDPQQVAGAAWLHTSGICLRQPPLSEAVLHAMRLARAAGVPVSLDLNLRLESFGLDQAGRERFWQAIRLSDVVLGSAYDEIAPLAGGAERAAAGAPADGAAHSEGGAHAEGGAQAALERALAALSDGGRTVVARLGAGGALAQSPLGRFVSPAFPAAVVDTLGAGDAFNGGFIAAQLAGAGLPTCLRWGNAAAALKIGQMGARGLPDRRQIELLLNGEL